MSLEIKKSIGKEYEITIPVFYGLFNVCMLGYECEDDLEAVKEVMDGPLDSEELEEIVFLDDDNYRLTLTFPDLIELEDDEYEGDFYLKYKCISSSDYKYKIICNNGRALGAVVEVELHNVTFTVHNIDIPNISEIKMYNLEAVFGDGSTAKISEFY